MLKNDEIMQYLRNTPSGSRHLYTGWIVGTILLGIGIRKLGQGLPEMIYKPVPDALWALVVYLLFCLLVPRKPVGWIFMAATLFSFGIEFSQLYHAPWLDSLRKTMLGGLILGTGFHWQDLIYYVIGTGFGLAMEGLVLKRRQKAQ